MLDFHYTVVVVTMVVRVTVALDIACTVVVAVVNILTVVLGSVHIIIIGVDSIVEFLTVALGHIHTIIIVIVVVGSFTVALGNVHVVVVVIGIVDFVTVALVGLLTVALVNLFTGALGSVHVVVGIVGHFTVVGSMYCRTVADVGGGKRFRIGVNIVATSIITGVIVLRSGVVIIIVVRAVFGASTSANGELASVVRSIVRALDHWLGLGHGKDIWDVLIFSWKIVGPFSRIIRLFGVIVRFIITIPCNIEVGRTIRRGIEVGR